MANGLTLMTADAPGVYNAASPSQWGIFLNGAAVLPSPVASFTYKAEWTIADYPIEKGTFASYDKVTIPFDARFRILVSGSESMRAAMLNAVDQVASDQTNIYDAVTPEKTYSSVSVAHYDYTRTAKNGVSLLQIDIWCFNVRSPMQSSLASTAAPSGADAVNDGTVNANTYPSTFSTIAGGGVTADTGAGGNVGVPNFPLATP